MAEYSSTSETGKCIFCEIAKWNIKPMWEWLIYEDDKYMAWLSPFPNTLWATIVIPKSHFASDVLEMPDDELNEFVLFAKKISKILINHFNDIWRVGLVMEWTWINHAHIKLFPMHGTEHMKKWEWTQYHSDNHKFFEKYEWYFCSNDWPTADFKKLQKLAWEIRRNI